MTLNAANTGSVEAAEVCAVWVGDAEANAAAAASTIVESESSIVNQALIKRNYQKFYSELLLRREGIIRNALTRCELRNNITLHISIIIDFCYVFKI